jgi:hypothetical protein
LTGSHDDILQEGIPYFVRVSAFNALGYGPSKASFPSNQIPSLQVPTSPLSISLATQSADSLSSTWSHPASDGGSTFKTAKIEWDPTDTFDSRHVVTINASSNLMQGSYSLSFGASASGCIQWNAVASGSTDAFENIVEGIDGIIDVSVTRSGDASQKYDYGYTYTVVFVNPVTPSKPLKLAVDQSACTQFKLIAGSADVPTEMSVTTSRTSYGEHIIDYSPEVQEVTTLS